MIPPGPYRIEPANDDESEIAIVALGDEQICTCYDWKDVPGSARALAELIVKTLESRP